MDTPYIVLGESRFQQIVGIPMDTNRVVFLTKFYLFTHEFEFMQHLILPLAVEFYPNFTR